jgi:hypothetical protein
MDGSVFCNNCGTPITGEPTDDPARRKPCPKCGSLGRGFKMIASTGVFTLTGHDVDLIYLSYPEKLLNAAQDLVEKGEFSIAVVVAHMACEISVERALSRAFKAKGIDYLEQPVDDLLPGYNLANERVRNLYNAVTGDEIQKQSFWQQFKESATRRNKAVHEGRIATKAEAEASFNAASGLVAYLK